MLYQLYETQRALMAPFADFAEATAKLYKHPLSPFTHIPGAQRVAAAFELVHRLGMDYEKPAFNITSVRSDGVDVAVQEQVAIDKPFCRLIRFKRFTDDAATLDRMRAQPTVLVVAPLSGHHATLLRDTVRSLLQDHKVFITDWTDARMVPESVGPFRLDDYVRYVREFIRYLGSDVHVISVCQPTVPVLAAVSLMASAGETTPLSMTMMGGPIDARKSPTAVNNLAMNRSYEWFENNVIYRVPENFPGAGRPVYPGFLQHTGFVAMNPDRHASSHWDYFLDLVRGDEDSAEGHRKFYDEYNAVLDLPAEYYLDTIKVVFQDFALVNGTWDVDEHRVRPQDIEESALLTIEGELDDISGAGQTRAAHDLCTSIPSARRFHYDVPRAGHYGIFAGSRWRDIVYPRVRDFIARFEKERLGDRGVTPAVKAQATRAVNRAAKGAATEAPSAKAVPARKAAHRPAAKAAPVAAAAPRPRKGARSASASEAIETNADDATAKG
jgi:poly(3-hydroxybutyrate) depolymerase